MVAPAAAIVDGRRSPRLARGTVRRMTDTPVHGRARSSIDGAVVTIEVGAPGELVALDPPLLEDLFGLIADAEADERLDVLVLRSAGAAFCVGASLDAIASAPDGGHDAMVGRAGRQANAIVRGLAESRLLTVAEVHGAAVGGGLALMLACDVAVAAQDTLFSVGYAAIGGTPDMGLSYTLTRAVGYRRALELYVTSERFDAARARELGLVTRVVPAERLREETAGVARALADGPSAALAQGKRLFRWGAEASLAQQLDHEIRSVADCAIGPEFQEGVRAFLEKRRPDFGGTDAAPSAP
jgi:2-(1,2-epoxy-1,2-dihydrophenyl)acetyl-CoA isomerase